MAAALASLGLARLGDIPGLTVTGAAAILAEDRRPQAVRHVIIGGQACRDGPVR